MREWERRCQREGEIEGHTPSLSRSLSLSLARPFTSLLALSYASLDVSAPCSFFTAADGRLAGAIMTILREANQVVPPELVAFAQVSGGHHGGGSEWKRAVRGGAESERGRVFECESERADASDAADCFPVVAGRHGFGHGHGHGHGVEPTGSNVIPVAPRQF